MHEINFKYNRELKSSGFEELESYLEGKDYIPKYRKTLFSIVATWFYFASLDNINSSKLIINEDSNNDIFSLKMEMASAKNLQRTYNEYIYLFDRSKEEIRQFLLDLMSQCVISRDRKTPEELFVGLIIKTQKLSPLSFVVLSTNDNSIIEIRFPYKDKIITEHNNG